MDKSKLCLLSNFDVLADELTLLILRLHLTNQHVIILRISTENTMLLGKAGLLAHVLLRDDNRNQKAWRRSLMGQEEGDSKLCGTFAYLRLCDKHFRHCSFTYYFLELFLNTLFFLEPWIFLTLSYLIFLTVIILRLCQYHMIFVEQLHALILQTKLAS